MTTEDSKRIYATPPEVGAVFRGPPIGRSSAPGKYVVAAIVDLGFFENVPSYYQVVFRFWSPHKRRYAWEVQGADAIDLRIYVPE